MSMIDSRVNAMTAEMQIFFWIEAKNQEKTLAMIKTLVMDRCRMSLLEHGFTVSSEVSTAISMSPLNVNMNNS